MEVKPTFSDPTWAIIELMGRHVIAGEITEVDIVGTQMLRVDVPETDGQPAFTKFYGGSAIYAITPTDEESARYAASHLSGRPVDKWTIPNKPAIPVRVDDMGEDEERLPF